MGSCYLAFAHGCCVIVGEQHRQAAYDGSIMLSGEGFGLRRGQNSQEIVGPRACTEKEQTKAMVPGGQARFGRAVTAGRVQRACHVALLYERIRAEGRAQYGDPLLFWRQRPIASP